MFQMIFFRMFYAGPHGMPQRGARLLSAGKSTGTAVACLLLFLSPAFAAETARVTDLAGRQLEIPERVERIILGESRYIPALAILDREKPLQRVVGMLADFKLTDPGSYRQYQQKFPEIDKIPLIGHSSADSFSLERVLTLRADLAIFGLEGHGPTSRDAELISHLERAGTTVVFVDFRQRPLQNTPRSIELLGRLLDRDSQAKEFIGFYSAELERVTSRLLHAKEPAPRVFLHSRVGIQDLCCETMVNGMMGTFIDAAEGINIAQDLIPGSAGVMNLEYLLDRQPDLYIATAIGSILTAKNDPQFVALGAGIDPATARASFAAAIKGSGVAHLQAVKNRRAYAVWHHFYNSPLNVVAVQIFAKWFYPETFKDLKPDQTLEELYRRFQPVPLDGTYWTEL